MSPVMCGYLERIWSRLYDTAAIAPGPLPTTRLFIAGIGTPVNGRIKTEADTNLWQSGVLEAPKRFSVRRIHLEILQVGEQDLVALKRSAIIDFYVNCKSYYSSPLHTLLLEDWLRKAVSEIAENKEKEIDQYLDRALVNGNLALAASDQKDLLINQQQSFSAVLQAPEPIVLTEPFVFRLYLEGNLFRAVA